MVSISPVVEPTARNTDPDTTIRLQKERGEIASPDQRRSERVSAIAKGAKSAIEGFVDISTKSQNLKSRKLLNDSAELDLERKEALHEAKLAQDQLNASKELANATVARDRALFEADAFKASASKNNTEIINSLANLDHAEFWKKHEAHKQKLIQNILTTGTPNDRDFLQTSVLDPMNLANQRQAAKIKLSELDSNIQKLDQEYIKNPNLNYIDSKKVAQGIVAINPNTRTPDIILPDGTLLSNSLGNDSSAKKAMSDAISYNKQSQIFENSKRATLASASGQDVSAVKTVEQETQEALSKSQQQFQQSGPASQGQQQPQQSSTFDPNPFFKPAGESESRRTAGADLLLGTSGTDGGSDITALQSTVNTLKSQQLDARFSSLPEALGGENEKFVLDELKREEELKREFIKNAKPSRDMSVKTAEQIERKVEAALQADEALHGADSILGGGILGATSRGISELDPETADRVLRPLEAAAAEMKVLVLAESGLGVRIADSEKEAEAFEKMSFSTNLSRNEIQQNLTLLKKAKNKIKDRSTFDNILADTNLSVSDIDRLFEAYQEAYPYSFQDNESGNMILNGDRPGAEDWLLDRFNIKQLPPKGFSAPAQPINNVVDDTQTPGPVINQQSFLNNQEPSSIPTPRTVVPNEEEALGKPEQPGQRIQETEFGITPTVEGQQVLGADTAESNEAISQPNGIIPKATPNLIQGLIAQESSGNAEAVSSAGAFGLTQLMPETGKELYESIGGNPDNYNEAIKDPTLQVALGTKYLNQQLQAFGGNVDLALAAYNAGPGNVRKAIRKAGGSENFEDIKEFLPKETQDYVPKVKSKAKVSVSGEDDGPTFGQRLATSKIGDVAFNALAAIAHAGNSATFGLSDEAVGLVSPSARDEIRQGLRVAEQEAPISSVVGKTTGAVGSAVAGGGANLIAKVTTTGAKGVVKRALATSAVGSVEAGLQAFGDAEGGANNRFRSALKDAPIGAIFGLGGSVISDGVVAVGGRLLSKIKGVRGKRLSKTDAIAEDILFKRLQEIPKEERIAAITALRDSGKLPKNLVSELDSKSIDTLADFIGTTSNTADDIARFQKDVALGSRTRISENLDEVFSSDDIVESSSKLLDAFTETKRGLAAARKEAASPIYDKVFKEGVKTTETLKSVVEGSGEIQSAIASVKRRLPGISDSIKEGQSALLDSSGKVIKGTADSIDDLHPKILDKALSTLQARAREGGEEGFFAREALGEFKEALFDAYPGLEQARAVYREGSKGLSKFTSRQTKILDKIQEAGNVEQLGKEMFKLNPRELDELKGLLGPQHKESFEQMGRNFLDQSLEETRDAGTKGFIKKFLSTPDKQDKFRAIVGEEKYRAVRGAFQDEDKLLRQTNVFSSNSKTQPRQEIQREIDKRINPILARFGETIQRKGANVLDALGTNISQLSEEAQDAITSQLKEMLITNPNLGADMLEKSLTIIKKTAGEKTAVDTLKQWLNASFRAEPRDAVGPTDVLGSAAKVTVGTLR